MADHKLESDGTDDATRRTLVRLAQNGVAALVALAIVAVMAHSFGVSII
jgi:hypothetical protein